MGERRVGRRRSGDISITIIVIDMIVGREGEAMRMGTRATTADQAMVIGGDRGVLDRPSHIQRCTHDCGQETLD